jgi:hypothetical protein
LLRFFFESIECEIETFSADRLFSGESTHHVKAGLGTQLLFDSGEALLAGITECYLRWQLSLSDGPLPTVLGRRLG